MLNCTNNSHSAGAGYDERGGAGADAAFVRRRHDPMAKVALITGVTGQDGSYLAELLLGKGYEVHGIVRRSSTFTTGRIDDLHKGAGDNESSLRLHYMATSATRRDCGV